MASVGTIKYKNGSSWIDILHPTGSFYISFQSTSPANLFGGTWTRVTNAALRGSTLTGYTGSDTHKLTTTEMPSHQHQLGQNRDMEFGYSYNASSGDRVYYGRYSDGGRPSWKLTAFEGGGSSTLNRATLLQLLYLVSHCVDRLEVSGNGRTSQI